MVCLRYISHVSFHPILYIAPLYVYKACKNGLLQYMSHYVLLYKILDIWNIYSSIYEEDHRPDALVSIILLLYLT